MVPAGRLVASLFVLCALVLGASVAVAQASAPATTPELSAHPEGHGTTASGGAAHSTPAPPAAAVPAPTPTFDPQAATRAWLAKVPAADKQRSDAYFEGGYWLQLWDLLYTLAVAWLLLGTGISRRLRELAQRTTRFRPLQTGIYALGYMLLTFVLGFPLAAYASFFREHKYGLSNQTFSAWLGDLAKGLAITLIFGTALAVIVYAVVRRFPRTWWLWAAGVVLALLAVVIIIAPVYIAPLFNEYTPLTDAKVRDPILRMAQANGVPADNVWVFDASKQTKRISANVSGFLGTERVSLNDNLLERATLPEIESVMGHELGHYVLNHVYEDFLELGIIVVLGLAFVFFTFEPTRRRWGRRWGVTGPDDAAGLPLLWALLAVFLFLATPAFNTIIRSNEAEADAFGLNAARQPDGFASIALKLGEYRKLDPGPVEEWLLFDHPSGKNRILMAMRWKAAHPGETAGP
ncbi:MAG TPA: M48 family metallopeptidase [Thermoanaerobaculia bacterium]|nr:M48 family metallopeptidase [Thermoanaerobaculia bacterium]